jgi:hypothetical protein
MSAIRTPIAGIPIPHSRIARETTEFVRDVSTPLLFDHSRRVFLWGALQGEREAIALHTTPEVRRYKQPEVRLTLRVEYDVLGLHFDELSAGMRDKPETVFGTMNTDILEATVPGYARPNFCDLIRNARFQD